MKNILTDNVNNPDFLSVINKSSQLRPFVHFSCSSTASMLAFAFFLLPQLAMLYLTQTFSSLFIVLLSVLGSVAAEVFYSFFLKKRFYCLTSIVQGIIIGLLLPSSYPLIPVFFLTFLSLLLFKYSFGGYAHPWINSVALTIAIAWIFDISGFPTFQVTRGMFFAPNPSLQIIQSGAVTMLPFDSSLTAFLNHRIFNVFGVSIPSGYVSFLWDSNSIIPAFRFNILTFVTSAFFFAFDFLDIIVPFFALLVYSILVFFCSSVFIPEIIGYGDIILALFSSGTLFCFLFLLPWIGTNPASFIAKIIYGVFAGVIAFFVSGCGTSPAGSVFTVILCNILSLFLQQIEDLFARGKMKILLKKEISIIMVDDNDRSN